jgi:hypothetical protein
MKRDIEDINAEIMADVWALLPGKVAAINAEKADGFDAPLPEQIIDGFESHIPETTPYAVFDVRNVEGQEAGVGVDVFAVIYIAFRDFDASANNKKAYYRYSRAIHEAIRDIKQRPYRSFTTPTWIGKTVGVYLPGMEGQVLKVGGCFVKYSVGLAR